MPNEARNGSSEVQIPSGKNSAKNFTFALTGGFKGNSPLRARQCALCHPDKIRALSTWKRPSGSWSGTSSLCRDPAWELAPGRLWHMPLPKAGLFHNNQRDCFHCWVCEPTKHGTQITHIPRGSSAETVCCIFFDLGPSFYFSSQLHSLLCWPIKVITESVSGPADLIFIMASLLQLQASEHVINPIGWPYPGAQQRGYSFFVST